MQLIQLAVSNHRRNIRTLFDILFALGFLRCHISRHEFFHIGNGPYHVILKDSVTDNQKRHNNHNQHHRQLTQHTSSGDIQRHSIQIGLPDVADKAHLRNGNTGSVDCLHLFATVLDVLGYPPLPSAGIHLIGQKCSFRSPCTNGINIKQRKADTNGSNHKYHHLHHQAQQYVGSQSTVLLRLAHHQLPIIFTGIVLRTGKFAAKVLRRCIIKNCQQHDTQDAFRQL